MNNVAKRSLGPAPETSARPRVGSARVVGVEPPWIDVMVGDSRARARLALAFTYQPVDGDEVLVISDAGEHWVIGVIEAKGKATMAFAGDLDVRAEGTLRLSGAHVELRGDEVRVFATKLKTFAESALETFGSVKKRVRDLLTVHAGEARTIVDGGAHTQADHASLLTKGKVAINGKSVHLG